MTLIRRAQKAISSAEFTFTNDFKNDERMQRRRQQQQRRSVHLGAPDRVKFYIGICCFVASAIAIASTFAPAGKNYFDIKFWRQSHTLSAQQRLDLRHQFPIHVDVNNEDDMENIVHPGYLLADKERLKILMDDQKREALRIIRVPKFWNPIAAFGEYEGGVREFLGNQGKYLITQEEATAIGSYYRAEHENFDSEKPTIFVAIASYRDPECRLTVESVFARAKYPERIRVAIIDQRRRRRSKGGVLDANDEFGEGEGDPTCRPPSSKSCRKSSDNILCQYIGQINWIEYDDEYMVGPVFARHIANRMYRGEYFALQVDSHVRFVANWDDDLIQQWTSTGNEMAVISTYMNGISSSIDPVTHMSLRTKRAMMCELEYEWNPKPEHIRFKMQPVNNPKINASPMLHPFWAAGFSFSRGHFPVSVPYDHYLPFVFQGEEILQAIRGFTFGYDSYAPARSVAFHIYGMKDNIEKRKNIHIFNENEVLFGPGVKNQAYLRLVGISGTTDPTLDYLHLDEEKYGLGQVRSRGKFFELFGIHPNSRTIEGGLCNFVQGTNTIDASTSMHVKFTPFLRYDHMGIDYSRIKYRHTTPHLSETTISEEELVYLRETKRRIEHQEAEIEKRTNDILVIN